jgi:hypothetical protein
VLGFLLARQWRPVGRVARNVILGWRIMNGLRTVWQDLKRKPDP